MSKVADIEDLANEFRAIVRVLDPRLDPFEAIADYVLNEREVGNSGEKAGTV